MSLAASSADSQDRAPDPERVRRRIRDAGFDPVRFARAGRAADADRYAEWLGRGYGASMEFLGNAMARRTDPREIVEGARSMIALGVFYRGPEVDGGDSSSGRARIAAYARGDDYHRVLERRLIRLCDGLRAEFPARYRWYVDTGPVLERGWARAAGLGWAGKNTCTIDPDRGSFLFLAAVITTLDLPPDSELPDHCGSCRRCIEACPTDAFPEPWVLDARRCISYLTIEHRGEVDPELEPRIGNLVFGCDICQEVCPFNRAEVRTCDPELEPRPENEAPSLVELAAMDREAFAARFPRSAVRRTRFSGFLRNVIIALGNAGTPEARRALLGLQEREDVRADAVLTATLARALQRAGDKKDP